MAAARSTSLQNCFERIEVLQQQEAKMASIVTVQEQGLAALAAQIQWISGARARLMFPGPSPIQSSPTIPPPPVSEPQVGTPECYAGDTD